MMWLYSIKATVKTRHWTVFYVNIKLRTILKLVTWFVCATVPHSYIYIDDISINASLVNIRVFWHECRILDLLCFFACCIFCLLNINKVRLLCEKGVATTRWLLILLYTNKITVAPTQELAEVVTSVMVCLS